MSEATTVERRRSGWTAGRLALAGLAVTLIGAVSYAFLLNIPWIRSHAVPNVAMVIVGLILCIAAVARRRSKGPIAALVVSGLVGGAFLLSFYVGMRLGPPQRSFALREMAPDFTLSNQDGEPVTLSSWRGKGPVLLVFYRGFW